MIPEPVAESHHDKSGSGLDAAVVAVDTLMWVVSVLETVCRPRTPRRPPREDSADLQKAKKNKGGFGVSNVIATPRIDRVAVGSPKSRRGRGQGSGGGRVPRCW